MRSILLRFLALSLVLDGPSADRKAVVEARGASVVDALVVLVHLITEGRDEHFGVFVFHSAFAVGCSVRLGSCAFLVGNYLVLREYRLDENRDK